MDFSNCKIGVIGLGYVGLPLAVEFGKKYEVIGFDINSSRIEELSSGFDRTGESSKEEMKAATKLWFSNDESSLDECNFYIVTVPTPIDQFRAPDLKPLLKASEMLAKHLKKGDIIIYESTVYPGCTEDECVPVLEKFSGLTFNKDFYCGYSPERINPGDKVNTLTKIVKVTSGSTPEIADIVDALYASIITAGTHKATNLKVAEASKAIENAQRDINISFVNEIAVIFDKIGIDTSEVLEAAGTKWNFLKYKPGLVGGHCIGVDPYYLAHKAESLGYYPQVILSGRRVNDNMGVFVANKVIKLMIGKGQRIQGANILILGVTFKENCPDIRNSRVIDIHKEFIQFGLSVDVFDPHADSAEVHEEYGIQLKEVLDTPYSAIVLAVSHDEFLTLDYNLLRKGKDSVIFDIKACLPRNVVDARL